MTLKKYTKSEEAPVAVSDEKQKKLATKLAEGKSLQEADAEVETED